MTEEEKRVLRQQAYQAAYRALEPYSKALPPGYELGITITLRGQGVTTAHLTDADWKEIFQHHTWRPESTKLLEIFRARNNEPISLEELSCGRHLVYGSLHGLGSRLPTSFKMMVVKRGVGRQGWRRSRYQIVKVVS